MGVEQVGACLMSQELFVIRWRKFRANLRVTRRLFLGWMDGLVSRARSIVHTAFHIDRSMAASAHKGQPSRKLQYYVRFKKVRNLQTRDNFLQIELDHHKNRRRRTHCNTADW